MGTLPPPPQKAHPPEGSVVFTFSTVKISGLHKSKGYIAQQLPLNIRKVYCHCVSYNHSRGRGTASAENLRGTRKLVSRTFVG